MSVLLWSGGPRRAVDLRHSDQDSAQRHRSLKAKGCGWSCKRIIAHWDVPREAESLKNPQKHPTRESARLCKCATLRGLQSHIHPRHIRPCPFFSDPPLPHPVCLIQRAQKQWLKNGRGGGPRLREIYLNSPFSTAND